MQCSSSFWSNLAESDARIILHGKNNSVEIFLRLTQYLKLITRALQLKLYNEL